MSISTALSYSNLEHEQEQHAILLVGRHLRILHILLAITFKSKMPQKSRCKYDKIVQPELIMEEGLMHVVIPWVIRRCHLSSAPTRDYVAECLDNVIKGIDAQGNKHVKDPVFSQIQKEIKCYLKVMKLNSIEINYDDSDEDDNDGKVQFNNCCYNGKDTMSDEDEDSIEYTPRGVWCKGEIVFAKYSRFYIPFIRPSPPKKA